MAETVRFEACSPPPLQGRVPILVGKANSLIFFSTAIHDSPGLDDLSRQQGYGPQTQYWSSPLPFLGLRLANHDHRVHVLTHDDSASRFSTHSRKVSPDGSICKVSCQALSSSLITTSSTRNGTPYGLLAAGSPTTTVGCMSVRLASCCSRAARARSTS